MRSRNGALIRQVPDTFLRGEAEVFEGLFGERRSGARRR